MRSRTQRATQEAYFEAVDHMQKQMDRANIDYRIVGSLASHALIAAAGGEPKPMRFQRPYAVEAVQALPDIDMIVPRVDLGVAREIREEMTHTDVPVSIGLAASSSEIDFRPDEDESYLTHRSAKFAVSNKVLSAVETRLHGVDVRTFPVNTQLHTYGTFGGMVRLKDMPTIRGLIAARDEQIPSSDMQPFRDFMRYRRANMTSTERAIRTTNYVIDNSPAFIGNAIKAAGKRAASRKGLR